MNGVVGLEWISQDFDPATQELAGDHHRLLLVDGHTSHFTYDFLKYAKEHKIEVLCLPSNTTHILQSCIHGLLTQTLDLRCLTALDVLGFSQFKTAYQKHANEQASQCGGRFNRADFLKAIEVPYRQAFRSDNVLKAFEVTGTWPVNRNRITADHTAPSIGLSLCGEATIAPTSPVKAIHAVLSHLQAPTPKDTLNPTSSAEATSPDTTNAALQHAIDDLRTKLQGTHVSFLFDGSAPSSAHKVQPLQFQALDNISASDGSCELGNCGSLESQSKMQLCSQVHLLKEENMRIRGLVQELITDRTTVITHCSLLFTENEKLQLGLFKKNQR